MKNWPILRTRLNKYESLAIRFTRRLKKYENLASEVLEGSTRISYFFCPHDRFTPLNL